MTNLVCSNRAWCWPLAESLSEATGEEFILITSPDQLTFEALVEHEPRYVFFPHWSEIIPTKLHENWECVVFHMTDLPYGRGGSPLQNLIQRGIYETKMTALRCVEELDAGPIYSKAPLSLHGSAEEIYIRAAALIERMIIEILQTNLIPEPQPGVSQPGFKRRTPADSDWSSATSLNEIFDFIRMLDAPGYPRAFIKIGDFRLEFSRAQLKQDGLLADVKITNERHE